MQKFRLFIIIAIFAITNFSVSVISFSSYHVNLAELADGEKFKATDLNLSNNPDQSPFILKVDQGNGKNQGDSYLVRYHHGNDKAELSQDIKYWSNIIYGGVSGTVIYDTKKKEVYKMSTDNRHRISAEIS